MEKTGKKKKIEASPTKSDPTNDGDIADASTSRNWSDLPQELLFPIFHRLSSSLPDLLSAAAVCRSWLSAAAASSSAFCAPPPPPLLLTPVFTLSGPLRWSRPAQCRLKTLTQASRSYRSMVPSKTLRKSCVGSSFGHLIFIAGKRVVLSDAFTGQEIRSPNLPSRFHHLTYIYGLLVEFSLGILTAPLNSLSQSLLLLISKNSDILCWCTGSNEWSELKLGNFVDGRIVSVAVVKEQIFVLDSYCNLVLVNFVPCICWKRLRMPPPGGTFMHHRKLAQHLVECGGELLLVIFVATGENQVYRLDLSKSSWEKMESLGNWCLFVHRKQVLACPNPTRWGGNKDDIYFIRPGCDIDIWTVVPLDGGVIDTSGGSPFSATITLDRFPWPSPIWICPNVFLSVQEDRN